MKRVKKAQKEGTYEEPRVASPTDVENDAGAALDEEDEEEPEQPKMGVWMTFGLLVAITVVQLYSSCTVHTELTESSVGCYYCRVFGGFY